jgi:hypothetical protein
MYAPGTILKLRKQRPPVVLEGKGEDGADVKVPFPYNRVRVVNQSPINHATTSSWDGTGGQGVIITPLASFGSTVDKPYGELQELYEVESIPENTIEAPKIRVIDSNSGSAGPAPEEVFAEEAAKAGDKPTPDGVRARTPFEFDNVRA